MERKLGRATGAVLVGVEARLVEVEVDLGGGLPIISAVGLADTAVREGVDRIRPALSHAGFKLPERRITVNLAPADVRKQGASLDLPIAVALLLADGQIPPFDAGRVLLAGELALDGGVRPIRGCLSMADAARRAGRRVACVPADNAEEAALAGLDVVPIGTLADVLAWSKGERPALARADPGALLGRALAREAAPGADLMEVRGQASARRALEIAAAGAHHLLLAGPPGSGKTMMARRLAGILPPLEWAEAVEVTRIWSAAGLARGLVGARPFRAPHHGVSAVALTGGGPSLRPGEISLASQGVLYLDELTEFRRDALEALRQPLEEGTIEVARVHASATFPAAFALVASTNLCPCGERGGLADRCLCTPRQIGRYLGKLSGPLLDRIDLLVEVPPLELSALGQATSGEPSSAVRERVVAARRRQRARFGPVGPRANARMDPRDLDRHAPLCRASRQLLLRAAERLGFSARGFDRVRRVARTLADLEGHEAIEPQHVAEALRYRSAQLLGRF